MAFLRRFHEHQVRSAHRAVDPSGISEDLTRLLGSQRDYASFLPGFGLGELWHRPITQRTLELLRKEILTLIVDYEPRLLTPAVVTLPRAADGTLRFSLHGWLDSGDSVTLRIELSHRQPSVVLVQGDAA